MKKNKLVLSLAGLAIAAATTVAAVTPAMAAETSDADAQYTNKDVVAFLLDGSGPIAEQHPDVTAGLGFVHGPAGIPSEVIADLTTQLESTIPDFESTVTDAITSGDPYLVESGLEAMETGLNSVGTVINSGDAVGFGAINPIVVVETLLVVAQAAAYDTAALWQNNAFWLAAAGTSTFGVQDLSAMIAAKV